MVCLKTIAETMTATATAMLVVGCLFKLLKPFMVSIISFIPLFFLGIEDSNGRRVRFCKAIKKRQEEKAMWKSIINALTKDYSTEDVLVLNKKELHNFVLNSQIFTKVTKRV